MHQFLAMLDDEAAVAAAVIPVERISGPLLLISGRDDQTWPSTYMSEQVVERFRRYSFSHPVTHLAYDDAGHAIGRPHFSTVNARGGTPEGNARARAQSWARMLEFLEAHLRRRR